MASINQGIHGHVTGKVGSLVYCSWKGINYVRSLPRLKKRKKPTEGQLKSRNKFSFVHNRLRNIVPILRLGFKHYADNMTAYNAAMSYNLKHAVIDDDAELRLDYENFAISRGLPSPITEVSFAVDEELVHVQWDLDKALTRKDKTNNFWSMLVVYAENSDVMSYFSINGEMLTAKASQWPRTEILSEKNILSGSIFHIYLSFVDIVGNSKSIDSVYVGKWIAP